MNTLILNLNDDVAGHLAAMAARSSKPLPEWAAEQLSQRVSASQVAENESYLAKWNAAFGSIDDSNFVSRSSSRIVESLDVD